MSENTPSECIEYWLEKARDCRHEGSIVQALSHVEHAIKTESNSVEARQFYIELLTVKIAQFDVSNKNHENTLRELIDAWGKLIDIEESLTHRKAQLNALKQLANLQDSPMIWVTYREACEQFFTKHNKPVDNDYAEALIHYANAFSYGVLQAFLDKHAGKPYNQHALEKISTIERELAENAHTQMLRIEQLMTFVRAHKLEFDIIEEVNISSETLNPLIEQIRILGFELLFVGRDKRLEQANQRNDEKIVPQVIIVLQKGATFATLSAHKITQTWLDKLLNKLWKKWHAPFKLDITLSTFFTEDIVLKSLNKSEQARHDAPKGYLVKCRNYDLQTQWKLHEEHVDELERRIEARRLNNLSKSDFLAQEAIYTDRLLAYKKTNGFMTFSEYHRATHNESRLPYSLILHGLAERIIEDNEGFCA